MALDIGTNSIGWALYSLDNQKKPCKIVDAGVRIFPSGRDHKTYTTLNTDRRLARLQRRQRDRYLQRRTYLLHLLKENELFPQDVFSAKKLASLNPYELRAKGLDEKIPLHHFGRALFHINQRRGFKSNRKSGGDKESGLINKSVKDSQKTMKELGARTYGEFLWKRFQKMEEERKIPSSQQGNWILARRAVGARAQDNYVVYAQRFMLEEEFNKLWDKQLEYHEKLKDKKLKDKFFKAIFHQRPLKQPIVGICEFTKEKRISRALPSFQKFRILKELNNLSYVAHGESVRIVSMEKGIEFRDKVIEKLFKKKKKVTFSSLKTEFKNFFKDKEDDGFSFNLDTFSRDDLEGNKTSVILNKIIPNWDEWSLENQDQFVKLLEGDNEEGNFMKEDEEVKEDIKIFSKDKNLNLTESQLNKCLEELNKLPDSHGRYSRTLIQKIIPYLEKGELESDAMQSAGYHHSNKRYKGELYPKLPPYQEILSDHCVQMKCEDVILSKKNHKRYAFFRIPNPTVHIAFNQLRIVINDIIKKYSQPVEIVVETSRDLPLGKITKEKLEERQKQNLKRNKEAVKAIDEFGQRNNRLNRSRYNLWKEQDCICVYSGKKIPKSKLYTAEVEVDHILPYSRTLDDGFNNKVLVYKSSNQNKGNQTAYEYFSSNKEQWNDIEKRIKNLSKGKQKKFTKNAMEEFEKEGGFLTRQLNDVRYISRLTKQYLEIICENIWTVRGQTTFMIRRSLQNDQKNRDDHRHHTIDALALGLVDRSLVQQISNIAKNIEGKNRTRLENITRLINKDVIPWPSFKEDAKQIIDNIVVSHRRRTKRKGQLHNDTAYGVSKDVKDFSKPIEVIHYVEILTLKKEKRKEQEKKLKKIISNEIRKSFLEELERSGTLSKEFLIDYHQKTGIRRVRIKETETVIPIRNKSKKVYKAFNGDSNYAIEIFETEKGKWDARVINTFEANQKDFKLSLTNNCLMKGDMLFFDNRFWRLVKFDKNKKMVFSEHLSSRNPAEQSKDKETKHQVVRKIPNSLKNFSPKRVHISPSGKWKCEPFLPKKLSFQKSKEV